MTTSLRSPGIATLALLLLAGTLAAQTINLFPSPDDRTILEFRYLRNIRSEGTSEFADGVYDFAGTIRISDRVSVMVDVPVVSDRKSFSAFGLSGATGGSTDVGNIFLGVRDRLDSIHHATFTAGVFTPTAASGLLTSSALANFYQYQKYDAYDVSLYTNVAARTMLSDGVFLGAETGPSATFYTGPGTRFVSPHFFAHLGVSIGYEGERFYGVAELAHMVSLTSRNNDSYWRGFQINACNLSFGWNGNTIQPALYLVLPFDDWFRSSPIDAAMGLRVGVVL